MGRRRGDRSIVRADALRAFELRAAGASARQIAKALGRDRRTIDRLLAAGPEGFASRRGRIGRPRKSPQDPSSVLPRNHTQQANCARTDLRGIGNPRRTEASPIRSGSDDRNLVVKMRDMLRKLIGLGAANRQPPAPPPMPKAAPPRPRAVLRPVSANAAGTADARACRSGTAAVRGRDDQLQVASAENHARLFLEYLWAEHPRGGVFKAADVVVLYGEFVLMRQMQPGSWNSVGRRLRLLAGRPKKYITENRRRIACYDIPPRPSARQSAALPVEPIHPTPADHAGNTAGLAA